jgi:hypothetical protein
MNSNFHDCFTVPWNRLFELLTINYRYTCTVTDSTKCLPLSKLNEFSYTWKLPAFLVRSFLFNLARFYSLYWLIGVVTRSVERKQTPFKFILVNVNIGNIRIELRYIFWKADESTGFQIRGFQVIYPSVHRLRWIIIFLPYPSLSPPPPVS